MSLCIRPLWIRGTCLGFELLTANSSRRFVSNEVRSILGKEPLV